MLNSSTGGFWTQSQWTSKLRLGVGEHKYTGNFLCDLFIAIVYHYFLTFFFLLIFRSLPNILNSILAGWITDETLNTNLPLQMKAALLILRKLRRTITNHFVTMKRERNHNISAKVIFIFEHALSMSIECMMWFTLKMK